MSKFKKPTHTHTSQKKKKMPSINCKIKSIILPVMFNDRTVKATNRIKQMCTEQRLKNFKRNAEILTALKYGKRKKKVSGKCYGMYAKN